MLLAGGAGSREWEKSAADSTHPPPETRFFYLHSPKTNAGLRIF